MPGHVRRVLPRAAGIDETIALVGLTEKAGALGTRLSGGQRRRLDSLSPSSATQSSCSWTSQLRASTRPPAAPPGRSLLGLRQLGKTVFLTTHYMDEAEYLADRIMVLSAGRIVAEGTPQTLGGRDRMTTTIGFTLPGHVPARDLPPELFPLSEPGPGGSTILHSETPLVHLQKLGTWALDRGFDLPDLDVHRPSLEEVYLSLTGSKRNKDQR